MKVYDKELHIGLIIAAFSIIIFGSIVIYSASLSTFTGINLAYKQLIFAFLLSIFCFILIRMDMKFIFDLSWIMYFITLILLIAVIFIGKSSHGAQRWIAIGSFALQPSEFSKIAIILALAKFMSSNIEDNLRISFIITSIFIVIVPLVIILKQPDLGTSLTLIPILTTMLFMAGIKKRYFMMLLPFALIPLIIIFLAKTNQIETQDIRNMLFFLKPYQQNRLLAFIDPNIDPRGISYNLIQSQIAVGSGGSMGKGFMSGTQTHLRFLPERHTDFAFSVLGEEWGFTGGILLLSLYFYILRTGLHIASACEDWFPKLASCGIVVLLLFHITTNIGMTIGLMPITGLPLPLISYGGSSLMTTLFSLSILLNFYANKEQVLFR